MDIGVEKPVITIEPVELPIPDQPAPPEAPPVEVPEPEEAPVEYV